MGVKGLKRYIENNIRAQYGNWIINKKRYKTLITKKTIEQNFSIKNNNSLSLIVDAYAYFYCLGDKLNWFIFDNLNLINLLKKVSYNSSL